MIPPDDRRGQPRGWRALVTPSLSDLFFIAIIVWMFMVGPAGWQTPLADGDTGWHIRTGEHILATGSIPTKDFFSFSKPGEDWYAWEWLADVAYAVIYRALGLQGIVLLTGVLVAAFGTVLLRYMIWKGANVLVALAVGLVALGAGSLHYTARPHLFTLLILVVALWLLDAYRSHPSYRVWLLVPLTAVWTNLHGGFIALFPFLGLLVVGTALEALVRSPRPADWWRQPLRYSGLGAACGAATLLNPFGLALHLHIVGFLRQAWVENLILEYQAPLFRTESELQFEVILFCGVLAASVMLRRRRFVEPMWILFWAHFALVSWRHIPIFTLTAAPVIAVEASRLWTEFAGKQSRQSVVAVLEHLSTDLAPGFRRAGVWPVILVLGLILSPRSIAWPQDFPEYMFPVSMAERHADLLPASRVFTSGEWAEYLLYRFYPEQKVFLDGRADFYGEEMLNDYGSLLTGQNNWREILDRYQFDVVLIPPNGPLASLLHQQDSWKMLDEDDQAALFVRESQLASAAATNHSQ